MSITDFFTNRTHVKEDVEIQIDFNQTSGLITGGSIRPEFCDSNGENVLRHPVLPLSAFTVTAGEKTTLETFIAKLITELRTDAGKSIFVPSPPG